MKWVEHKNDLGLLLAKEFPVPAMFYNFETVDFPLNHENLGIKFFISV